MKPLLYAQFGHGNFGDEISRTILTSLTGEPVEEVAFNDPRNKVIVCGSIAHLVAPNTTLWGTGQLEEGLRLHPGIKNLDIRMLRGPRSSFISSRMGYPKCKVHGDGGVFAAYAYRDSLSPMVKGRIGIVQHFKEPRYFKDAELPPGCIFIDMTKPPAEVIALLSSCERLVCSSLHGIVVGESLGIPCSYYRWSDHCDTFKYFDYFEGTGRDPFKMPWLDNRYARLPPEKVLMTPPLPLPKYDFDAMMAVAPFDIPDNTKNDIIDFYNHIKERRTMSANTNEKKDTPITVASTVAPNTDKPRFSIVIPCRNAANYIVRCLSSIANQTFGTDRVQIVFVDDGSGDGSGFIAERFLEDFPHYELVKVKGPSGPGGARNRGVEKATGEYLFLVDVDDYLPPKSLELIDKAITEFNNPDVVLYPYEVLRPKDSKRINGLVDPPIKNIQQAAGSAVGPWTHVCKTELYVPMPEKILSEDTAWHFAQFDNFETFGRVNVKEACYVYDRLNATAITDTVEWAGSHSFTLEQLAFNDEAIKAGKNDQWISDVIRNYANMYDVRRRLKHPWVKEAWAARFKSEISNLMTGHFVH